MPLSSRRIARGLSLAALTLTLAAPAAPPALASGGTTHLGNPRMETLTAEIAPPYTSDFNLRTVFSAWPPLGTVIYKREDLKDSTGMIWVAGTFNTFPTNANRGAAMANDAGTFLSWAEMKDPFTYLDHVGVFSFTQWAQSFRKDSANATFHFKISGAKLYTMCLTGGARAEFAMDAWAYHNGQEFFSFYEACGLRSVGDPPRVPRVEFTAEGPMIYSESNPDGIHRDYQLVFNPITIYIDISGIPVGDEFSVVYNEMTQGNIKYDDTVRAFAYFRDPLNDSTGVSVELSGLTPTDDPRIPATVAVSPPPPARTAALSPARPNPSSGAVSFALELHAAGDVTVGVFDLTGRRVAEIARREFAAGTHALAWDGRGDDGALAPAGVYFVRAAGPHVNLVQRVVRIASR